MDLFFVLIVWVLFALAMGGWASSWGRSGAGYFALSFFFSPILSTLVLLVAGNKAEKEAGEVRRAEEQRREHERQLEAIRSVKQPVADAGLHSVADELGKLLSLHERGLLTPEEFAVQKARLLSRS
jgi:hypothetical protein